MSKKRTISDENVLLSALNLSASEVGGALRRAPGAAEAGNEVARRTPMERFATSLVHRDLREDEV
jgi:hypothetical protein